MTVVLIQWNTNFADTARLAVRAVNMYGESRFSEAKEIIVYPSNELSSIIGPDSVCTVTNSQSVFSTELVNQQSLQWHLSPETAGEINNQQDTAIISWNLSFEGTATLKTALINTCDAEEYSPTKEIHVKTCVGIGEIQAKELKIYPNPADNQITFELPTISKESSLQIKDIFGNTVAELPLLKGQSQVQWNCSPVASGVYFYQTKIGGEVYRGKLVIN